MKKLICVIFTFILVLSATFANGNEIETVWILCQPNSYVNVRARPSGRSEDTGYLECGDSVETDGKKKNGFLHIFPSTEAGDGWISLGYIVYEKPERVWKEMKVVAKGRVNARKTVNGKRRVWVMPETVVMVYWVGEWAVTNKGFIKSKFLGDVE